MVLITRLRDINQCSELFKRPSYSLKTIYAICPVFLGYEINLLKIKLSVTVSHTKYLLVIQHF